MSYELRRREFIQVLMSLPLGYALGCAVERMTPGQQSLHELVLALGPWPTTDRARAEEFAARFLAADDVVGLYLPESSSLILSLARRFPDGAMAVGEVDLEALPDGERELLVGLTQQIYSIIEVRFYVSSEPPWGECLGGRERYTQAPGYAASALEDAGTPGLRPPLPKADRKDKV